VLLSPRSAITAWLALVASHVALAAEIIHQSPQDFLDSALPGCSQKALWLKADARADVEAILDHPFPGVRARYCELDGSTAWILDEVGKTEPITTGILVSDGRVEQVRVLVFRETRGGEVHREAFVKQYDDATLDKRNDLDRNIDGITGATLSVGAVNRQVRLALLFDRMAREKNGDG
jgi:hypothetical protein